MKYLLTLALLFSCSAGWAEPSGLYIVVLGSLTGSANPVIVKAHEPEVTYSTLPAHFKPPDFYAIQFSTFPCVDEFGYPSICKEQKLLIKQDPYKITDWHCVEWSYKNIPYPVGSGEICINCPNTISVRDACTREEGYREDGVVCFRDVIRKKKP